MAIEETVARPPAGRLVAGVTVFVLGWIVTLASVSLITSGPLPASIVPVVVFVLPKVGVLAAVAIMGKPGFAYLKNLVFGSLKPAHDVSPLRHRIGVSMFAGAILISALEPYGFFRSGFAARNIQLTLAVDLVLLASVFVLGGNFWDKIRALFVREARVIFPVGA
jgi:hypothetical protein